MSSRLIDSEKLPAKKPIQLLCLEDNTCDRELLEVALTSAGLVCEYRHVMSRQEFEAALQQQPFDLIISDFSLPGYDGLTALAAAQKLQADTPYIFLSGTIGEDRAIESLKGGATDYVLKDRRERLVSAVQRALRERQERIERRKLEEQLRQSQKMDAIGQLAGGVAHDFNNILTVIQGNAELALKSDQQLNQLTRDFLIQITKASERAAKLTRQLLAFGRKSSVQLESLKLEEVIGNLTKMLDRIVGEDIRLECHCSGQSYIRGDAGMMEQVLLNLVVNARDAMPQGGRVTITAQSVTIGEKTTQAHAEARSGEFVCLSVRDNGTGIAPENLSRIFEPFFTTKEVGKGTGLGLATVYGIVKQHQGWINVQSQLGEGTVFEIFLPAVQGARNGATVSDTEAMVRGGTERILLVEDDEAVRSMTRQTLESFGYQVMEAVSGLEALQIRSEYDLLLTDMVMPGGVTGRELAERLRTQIPGLKVIFSSGYSSNVTGTDTNFFQRPGTYFLQKPYHVDALIYTVRKCLDEVSANA
jgi:two-component system cell cycle sensor histidine kinase/response regulator CckA